jgi:hypothetical protein
MPAYWWMYNLYALERNSWKYIARDKRKHPRLFYETEYLAPDTVGRSRTRWNFWPDGPERHGANRWISRSQSHGKRNRTPQ